MFRAFLLIVGLVIPGFVESTADAQPTKNLPAQFGWMSDYKSARAEARRTGKPMMVVFRCVP